MKTFDELWPIPYPKIVIVTGEYGGGKSTFALSTGAEPARMAYLDFEKSGGGYASQIGVGLYADIQAVLTRKYPSGYKMIQLLAETRAITDAIAHDQYDVIILDNASPLEEALTADVEAAPTKYNLTQRQVENSTALKMYAVKTAYMQYISALASKARMVILIVQLRDKFNGNSPAKNARGETIREPKGKETLELLSGLYLWLEHGKGGVPSANVRKSRVDKKVFVTDPAHPPAGISEKLIASLNGDPGLLTIPVLPLRLPRCTWQEIRWYMSHPADMENPKPGEMPTKDQISDDDRLFLRARIAETELALAENRTAAPTKPSLPVKPVVEAPKVDPKKAEFFEKAAAMGYADNESILAVLKPLGLTPWASEIHDAMIGALKEAKAGAVKELRRMGMSLNPRMLNKGFPYLWTVPVAADLAAGIDPARMELGSQFADDLIGTLGQGTGREMRSFAWGIVSRLAKHSIEGSVLNLIDTANKLKLLDFGMACFQAGRLVGDKPQ